jgi:hypothetical protein
MYKYGKADTVLIKNCAAKTRRKLKGQIKNDVTYFVFTWSLRPSIEWPDGWSLPYLIFFSTAICGFSAGLRPPFHKKRPGPAQ